MSKFNGLLAAAALLAAPSVFAENTQGQNSGSTEVKIEIGVYVPPQDGSDGPGTLIPQSLNGKAIPKEVKTSYRANKSSFGEWFSNHFIWILSGCALLGAGCIFYLKRKKK